MTSRYPPEGRLLHTPENEAACASAGTLRRAMEEKTVLEGVAQLCDESHNLLVSVGPFTGVIPREEAALGIAEGTTREIAILSRVGRPVCFTVEGLEEADGALRPRLSRRRAQRAALDAMLAGLRPGMIIPAVVTHLEPFGAFVDIGCGVPSLIGIENISVSRIPHPGQRFRVGQAVCAAVLDLDPRAERIYLTHRELLGRGLCRAHPQPVRPGGAEGGPGRGAAGFRVHQGHTARADEDQAAGHRHPAAPGGPRPAGVFYHPRPAGEVEVRPAGLRQGRG